jgi:hypothetical protein
VADLETGPALPFLEDLHRFVRGVVDDYDLVFGVVELVEAGEEALDHALFVVGRDMDRDERVISEVDVVPVSVSVAVPTDSAQSGRVAVAVTFVIPVAVAIAAA